MNVFIKTLLFLYFIGHCHTTNTMFKTYFNRFARVYPIKRINYTTKPRVTTVTTSFFDKLKNWFSAPTIPFQPARLEQSKLNSIETSKSITPITNSQLENINNPAISNEKAFNNAFKIVTKNNQQLNIIAQNANLIICPPPGPELLWLSKINSIDDMEQFFITKRKEILKEIMSAEETENFIFTITKNKNNVIENRYTTPQKDAKIVHDQSLAHPSLETIKNLLTTSGINPDTISITKPSSAIKLINEYQDSLPQWTKKNKIIQAITNLALSLKYKASMLGAAACVHGIKNMPMILCFFYMGIHFNKDLANFIIAHEIGHLLRNHHDEIALIETIIKNKKQNNSTINFDLAYQKLRYLYELEADATVALINPIVANLAYQELLYRISNPDIKLGPIPIAEYNIEKSSSPIHSGIIDRFNLMKKIKALHEQTKPATKNE